MSGWEEVRRQVAIAGSVTREKNGKAVGGVCVTITSMPQKFQFQLNERPKGSILTPQPERIDQAITASDGTFFFLELPEGQYELTASLHERDGGSGKGKGEVALDDKGNIIMASVDIVLKPQGKEKKSKPAS